MTWLVTGGAGYIGAHVVRAFGERGLGAVVLDDLSSGHRRFVPDDVPFVDGDIRDTALVTRTLREHAVEGVVHVAGFKYAGVSVQRPLHTYDQNVTGTVSVLRAMARRRGGQGGVLLQRRDLRHPGRRHRSPRRPRRGPSRRTARAS